MKTAILALSVLFFGCAHQGVDPRLTEFSSLYKSRVACEAAFAAFYITKVRELLAEIEEEGGGFPEFERRVARFISLKENIKVLIRAIDAQLALGLKHIETGTPGDIFMPARELVYNCTKVVTDLGLPLPTPHLEKEDAPRTSGTSFRTRRTNDLRINPPSGLRGRTGRNRSY